MKPAVRCYAKRMYLSWEEAEKAALKVMEEAPDGRGPLIAYLCNHDRHHWHIGHSMDSARRRAVSRPEGWVADPPIEGIEAERARA